MRGDTGLDLRGRPEVSSGEVNRILFGFGPQLWRELQALTIASTTKSSLRLRTEQR
jgi:hypothetical protein